MVHLIPVWHVDKLRMIENVEGIPTKLERLAFPHKYLLRHIQVPVVGPTGKQRIAPHSPACGQTDAFYEMNLVRCSAGAGVRIEIASGTSGE